jgi:alkanesulfonate monooxygenase SsuD/methylene tetrahydromethanopterin reductase-like flavin-dependent oxidoreductase (luciferase family)
MTVSILRFTFAAPHDDPSARRDRIRAALQLSQWGEARGLTGISVDEHHATGHGWSCNPILAASFFLTGTERLIASADCALGPLWDPVRLAEDIALVDTMSGGRLIVTIGLGYRPTEYEMFGKAFEHRGRLMDQLIETVLTLWSGMTPGPLTRPHPPIFVGGSVRATAERAAKYKLPLSLPNFRPDLAEHYRTLCKANGHTPMVLMPPAESRGIVFLHEDPDRAWAELGEHILWEARVYSAWSEGHAPSFMHIPDEVRSIDDVRSTGRYRFMTPEELLDDIGRNPREPVVLHPLIGEMPIDEAWKSVQLLTDRVLPQLQS